RSAEEATPAAEPAGKQADRNANEARKAKKADRKRDRRNRPRTEPRDAPDPEAPDVYVEVYNNTTITGLAASTAAQLQDGGWQVVGVDNWRGDIPSSTVYYPAGMEDEADQLADTLGFGRVRGAVAPMKFDRLTVILTPDAA
ncbi:MAG: LytR C-terminal domain-containing protein, partial [Nocardioidaceae bacterium]